MPSGWPGRSCPEPTSAGATTRTSATPRARSLRSRTAPSARGRVLYVCEPTAQVAERATGDVRGWGYTEHEALDRCLGELAAAAERPTAVRVRLHPAEDDGKYDAIVAAHADRLAVEVSRGRSLADDCAWAGTVIGCDTMAMVVALAAGRRVVCALPPGARPLSLPFPEIERLHAA